MMGQKTEEDSDDEVYNNECKEIKANFWKRISLTQLKF